ncbi:MAG: hypothetical protein AUK35_07585 [Zetaproteobacteria bacterium CG2_30_46_52]|nr:MAG: hypothetical protein AUK35_07585 [Zetaproteobacteria bacterium CG2_30_46_52]
MKNNTVFKKITIANNLKQFEIKEVFALGGLELSSSAIKSFTAGSQNKNHLALTDEQLTAFFDGLILYWRGGKDDADLIPRGIENYVMNLMKDGSADLLEELACLVDDAKDGVTIEAAEKAAAEKEAGQGADKAE